MTNLDKQQSMENNNLKYVMGMVWNILCVILNKMTCYYVTIESKI